MITPDDLLIHMYKVLPKLSSRFFVKTIPMSAEINQGLELVVTLSDTSGFKLGRRYNINEVDMINPVTNCIGSMSQGWTLTTSNPHRITKPMHRKDRVKFITFGTWGGEQIITDVPDRQTVFTRNGEDEAFIGSIIERLQGEDGFVECVKVDGNTAHFKMNEGYVYPSVCNIGFITKRLNIAVVSDIDRAGQVYTQNMKDGDQSLFAFLIMGDRNVIADKNADAGIVAENGSGHTYLKVTTGFNIVIFWPRNKTQEAAKQQIQEAYGEINTLFNRVFFGYKYNRTDGLKIMPVGSGYGETADKANFCFVYEYQVIDQIQTEHEGYSFTADLTNIDVPVRDIEYQMYVSDGHSDPQSIYNTRKLDEVHDE